jgi:thymidine kinase
MSKAFPHLPPSFTPMQTRPKEILKVPVRGKIIAIIGPMFSCKTMDLIQLVTGGSRLGKRAIIIRHGRDKRFDDTDRIRTHDNYVIAVDVPHEYKTELTDNVFINTLVSNYDVIAVDEGQWFKNKDELVTFAKTLRAHDKTVIVAGLVTDKNQVPYQSMLTLMAHANELRLHVSGCKQCGGEDAIYTRELVPKKNEEVRVEEVRGLTMEEKDEYKVVARAGGGFGTFLGHVRDSQPSPSSLSSSTDNYVKVGGANDYEAVCAACYDLLSGKIN